MTPKTNEGNPQGGQEKEDPITTTEIEQIARRKLPQNVWDYYACGSDDQYALRRNVDVFSSLYICPRVLRNVSFVDTRTSIFGTEYPLPLGVAPSAMQKLVGGEGEMDAARATQKVGVNITLSSQSTTSLEDLINTKPATTTEGPQFWFQIYLTEDLEKSAPLIRRAEAAGYEALVLTVDTPVLGNRINERKVPLTLPPHLRLANIEFSDTTPKVRKPTFNRLLMDSRTAIQANTVLASAGGSVHSSSLTWETTIPFLRRTSNLKIILKGIMTPEDAELAVRHGADAIVVSNHGGRQLDSVASALDVLPDIAKVVDGRIPVIMDGGIRRGSDIYKALALGADFVCIGRPVLWGLSYDGQNGVETVLHILERELSRTMALAGVATVADIKGSALHVINKGGFGVSRL